MKNGFRIQSVSPSREKRRFSALFLLFALVLLLAGAVLFPRKAYAGFDSAYTTTSYDVGITVGKDHVCTYTETISVDFSTPRHGIYRYIPLSSDYQVKDISVEDDDYSLSTSDGNKVIRIGSSDETVTGPKTYVIHYTLQYYKDSDPDTDELYLDIFPTSWSTDVEQASVRVSFPEDFDMDGIETYSGNYYSTSNDYGSWDISSENHTLTFTASNLPYNVGATIREKINGTYWEGIKASFRIYLILPILLSLGGFVLMVLLFSFARKDRADTVETVEFYPPDNLSPPEIGYAWDDSCDEKDITALLFDLAAKGYIQIEECGDSKGKGSKHKKKGDTDYAFIKKQDPPESENRYVKQYFEFLFGDDAKDKPEGTRVFLGQCKDSFYDQYKTMKDMVTSEFKAKKTHSQRLYNRHSQVAARVMLGMQLGILIAIVACALCRPASQFSVFIVVPILFVCATGFYALFLYLFSNAIEKSRFAKTAKWKAVEVILGILYYFLTVVLLVLFWLMMYFPQGGFLLAYLPTISFALFALTAPLFSGNCLQRSPYGARLLGKIRGFRTFIEAAEADRLNELLRQDPDYYYRILPYAYVFGLVKNWGQNFKNIAVPPPSWYVPLDPYAPMDIIFISRQFNSISSQIALQIAADKVSVAESQGGGFSGGISGGGFTGGGGGGGGGGSW